MRTVKKILIFGFFTLWHLISDMPDAIGDVPKILTLDEYENNILDSGGPLLSDQAAYNVYFYDLDLHVNPDSQHIHGSVTVFAEVIDELERFVVHLDTVFRVEQVNWIQTDSMRKSLDFVHENGLIIAGFPDDMLPGQQLIIEVTWSGHPRSAPNPPWEGGFTWAKSESGEHWVGVSCQVNGADIWWPVKDHPSDRPDSVSFKITVPDELMAVSNGVLRSVKTSTGSTRTFHWVTNSPISNYSVTMNIGPFVELNDQYESISGDTIPVYFWALPENAQKAENLLIQVREHLRFFEELLGPYPFLSEKYGVVETPFLGMEHQTLIAYGAGYENDVIFNTNSGFDDLHHHELAHEWWGNHVVAADWKDFWIHEGFGTYMQPLYAEKLHGKDQYKHFMKKLYDRIDNTIPVAPEQSKSTRDMYNGRDIYMKGAWVLHTLRMMIGDELFFESLRLMIRPESDQISNTPISPGRFVDTRDYIEIVESLTGQDLDWFFDAYLRHKTMPELHKQWKEGRVYLKWDVPSGKPFPMPVEVYDGKELQTVMPDPGVFIMVQDSLTFKVDPDNLVLRALMFQ